MEKLKRKNKKTGRKLFENIGMREDSFFSPFPVEECEDRLQAQFGSRFQSIDPDLHTFHLSFLPADGHSVVESMVEITLTPEKEGTWVFASARAYNLFFIPRFIHDIFDDQVGFRALFSNILGLWKAVFSIRGDLALCKHLFAAIRFNLSNTEKPLFRPSPIALPQKSRPQFSFETTYSLEECVSRLDMYKKDLPTEGLYSLVGPYSAEHCAFHLEQLVVGLDVAHMDGLLKANATSTTVTGSTSILGCGLYVSLAFLGVLLLIAYLNGSLILGVGALVVFLLLFFTLRLWRTRLYDQVVELFRDTGELL